MFNMIAKGLKLSFIYLLYTLNGTSAKIIYEETKNYNVCLTPTCVKIASSLLDSIDFNVDPCDDFFNFSCGKWIKDNIIPDDKTEYSVSTGMADTVQKQMKILLEDGTSSTSSKVIKLAKMEYLHCVNMTQINSLKSDLLIKMLNQFGGWPLLDPNWKDTNTNLTKLMGDILRNFGANTFVSISVNSQWKDPNKTMLYIDQGTLGLGYGYRDYYLNDTLYKEQMDAYKKYILDVIKILAGDLNLTSDSYKKEVDEMLEFEKKLANITIREEDRRNYTTMYNPRTVDQLSEMLPIINWKSLFKLSFDEAVYALVSKPKFLLNVQEPQYLQDLQTLLSKTKKKTIMNYIFWDLVSSYVGSLDVRYEDVYQAFQEEFSERKIKPIRWKHCVNNAISGLHLASGAMYVRKYFTKEDKAETLEMIKQLLVAFKDMVRKLDWMDEKTKKLAIEKADAIRNSVGYPDFLLNDTALDDFYKNLNYQDSDSFFEIERRISVWSVQKMYRDLLKPFDRDRFEMSPAEVNAYYSPEKNSINFPAAILKFPFFQADLPKYINYGSTGATIGHEMTHGFDDQGSQYDKNGGLFNWWSDSSLKQFLNKSDCMIAQYDKYIAPGTSTHLSGEKTVGENIADNGGLKEAYNAYINYVIKSGEEMRLPGLSQFTNEQMFFISYAYAWCGKHTPAASLQQALTDVHSPEMFRVNGVVVNSEQFANVFKCKVGTTMNPQRSKQPRCSVW